VITLDTNLLARLLLRDDTRQHEQVKRLLAQPGSFTAPVTVMLELVWVLEVNDCTRAEIVNGLGLLLGLPNFGPERPEALRRALHWYREGMDFADALHLALSAHTQQVSTLDKAFVRQARRAGAPPPVVSL
jgi:predicted nucleic-acid-binding protein